MKKLLILLFLLSLPCFSTAAPTLNFSDLIDGPKSGLGDSLGQGAIVTVWGNRLGSSKGSSEIYVRDSLGVSRAAAYTYTWCNADGGISGGGPSDLYTRQKMQEISFSIPSASADGAGKIYVVVSGETSNELDFYVRSTGDIFHVMSTGSDSSNGTYSTPWLTINGAVDGAGTYKMDAGDICYIHTLSVSDSNPINIGSSVRINGSANNMCGLIAYPGANVSVSATGTAVRNYYTNNTYWTISKISATTTVNGISCFGHGRIVGNAVTGPSADGSSGAIASSTDPAYPLGSGTNGVKVFGNYVHNFGSSSTSNKHHATYFSIRYAQTVEGFEVGWNYLSGNKSRYGIHYYDETAEGVGMGDFSSPCSIHNNWIENQAGSGINIGTRPDDLTYSDTGEGTFYVYNNVMLNCGLVTGQGVGANAQAIGIYGEQNTFNTKIYNNLIYGFGEAGNSESAALYIPLSGFGLLDGTWEWVNNIVVDLHDGSWSWSGAGNIKSPELSGNNLWYNGGDSTPSAAPTWDTTPLFESPLFTNSAGLDFTLTVDSPCIDAGHVFNTLFTDDLLSIVRGTTWDIGPYEYEEGESPPVYDSPVVTILTESQSTTAATITIIGTLTTDSALTGSGVSVNGVAATADDGTWNESVEAWTALGVSLSLGENTITATGTDSETETGTDTVLITRTAPAPFTLKTHGNINFKNTTLH